MAKILLMDDDIEFSFDLAQDLRKAGHDVTTTADATAARQELGAEPYDLLITDIIVYADNRPVPDGGITLIDWARWNARTFSWLKDMPILAISGTVKNPGMEYIFSTAKQMGANSGLPKPIVLSDLLAEIEKLTSRPG